MGRNSVDVVKGLLVLAVIVGHNEAVTHSQPWLRQILYYFHVQCFFLLSSHLDVKPLTKRLLIDRAVRYLVPFGLFMLLAWLAFRLVRRDAQSLVASLWVLGAAVFTGNQAIIHDAVGMRYLWFLPSLYSLVVLKAAAQTGGLGSRLLLGGAIVWMAAAAFVPEPLRRWLPLGSGEGMFFFGLGELFRMAVKKTGVELGSWRLRLPAAIAAAALAIGIVWAPLGWVAAANVGTYDIRTPATWLVGLVFPCLMLPTLMSLAGFLPESLLGAFGRYSLPVYLVHMFIYRLLTFARFGRRFDDLAVVGTDLLAGLIILTLTAGLSLLAALGIWRRPRLRAILFPRDWPEWRAALGIAAS